MTNEEKIKGLIRSIGSQSARTEGVLIAEVVSVDQEKATMKVKLDEELQLEEIRLRSIIDGDQGMYIVPQEGTKVILLRLGEDDEFLAVAFEKYDKVIIKGESISLEISQEIITFNGNRLDSFMPDINALVDKINELEQQINDLKGVFRNWAPVPQDGGAQLKMGAATWAATNMVKTTKDDIKDDKILN